MARLAVAALGCGCLGVAATVVREPVRVPGWPELKGFPLSFAIRTEDMVYVSGLGGMDMRTGKKAAGVGNETRQALSSLSELMQAAGGSLEDVVSCGVMLADLKRDFGEMNAAYAKFFPKSPPSRVAVQAGLAGGSVEIKCIASLRGGKEVVAVPGWPSMAGKVPLSMVTRAHGTVYASGMQGLNMSTFRPVPGGVAAETAQTLANVGEALEAAGSGLDLALGCEVSLADMADFSSMTEAYVAAFPKAGRLGGLPARIAVQVGGLAGSGRVEIRCTGATPGLRPVLVTAPAHWKSGPVPFSFATKAGGMVYVSGMAGIDMATMRMAPGGVGNETRQALSNIKELLESAGTTIENVVECEVSLADMADFKEMNAAYAPFWPQAPPARAAVQVGGLFSGRVEIKCTAAAGAGSAELVV